MRALTALMLGLMIGNLPGPAMAADEIMAGVFQGTGRACSGALFLRARTVEWNSTYSICKPTQYEILEKNASNGQRRVVLRLKERSRLCRYSVVELEQAGRYNWNVSGYQSLEGFRNRELPDWKNSSLPDRQVLSCLMTGPD